MQPDQTPTPDEGAGAADGPWAYRPRKHDDWGVIRNAKGQFVARAWECGYLTDDQMDEHRRNRTDPSEANARLIVEAVNAHLAAQRPASDGWRPIETAPKDGRDILAFVEGFGMGAMVLFWSDGYWREKANCMGLKKEPSGWRPVPNWSEPTPATDTVAAHSLATSPVAAHDNGVGEPQAAEVERLREALREAEDLLRLVEHPSFRDPVHGDAVEELGSRIGYGALMSSAAASWHAMQPQGAYVAGPTIGSVKRTLAIIRAALSGSAKP